MSTNQIQGDTPTRQLLPLVSVIIPTWNRKDELLACIRSLQGQRDVRLEIIVADDGSTDDTVSAIRDCFPDIKVVGDERRYGHPYRRNQAFLISTGEFILNLDSDVDFPDPGTLARMANYLRQDAKIGAIGGEIPLNFGNGDVAYGLGMKDYPYRVAAKPHQGLVECQILASLNCMTRREVTMEVGGFDPYYEFGGPDADYCQAIIAAGYRNYVSYETAVLHRASPAGRRNDESYNYCLAGARFAIKHRGMPFYLWQLVKFTAGVALTHFASAAAFLLRDSAKRTRLLDKMRGGRMLLKAYYWSLLHWRQITRMRKVDFLSPDAMQEFVAYKREGTQG